jgi:hypothetical protein
LLAASQSLYVRREMNHIKGETTLSLQARKLGRPETSVLSV